MKRILVFAALIPALTLAYPLGMPNIKLPSPLNQGALEFEFQHRYYGSLLDKPLENFFGLDIGANALLGLKYTLIKGLEIKLSRTSFQKEINADLSYSHFFPKLFLRARVSLNGFTYKPDTSRVWSVFPNITLESEPILGRIKPLMIFGYDFDTSRFILGGGLSILVLRNVGYFEEISLLGEYYLGPRGVFTIPEMDIVDAFVGGVGLSTYGHQFILTVSNATQIGPRRLAQGEIRYQDEEPSIYIGLMIRRLLLRGSQ